MEELIMSFLIANPKLAILVTIMAVARAIFKPLCAVIQAYVDSTPSESDNVTWLAIKESKIFKALAYAMDFLLSVKIPSKTV